MLFNEEFVDTLKDDPVKGVVEICRIAFDEIPELLSEWGESEYEALTEAYALIEGMIETGLITIEIGKFDISGELSSDCTNIHSYLVEVNRYFTSEVSKLRMQYLKSHFKTSLGSGFCYEFSQGDLERIQVLINQLHELIAASNHFEKEHQQRLLKRLEKLQSEMHKRISDLDRFWGLIGDAGVALGKFGKDAKPFVDLIKEITKIVWQTQSRAEELPSGTPIPLIEGKADKEEEP
jgi:hypothetical protein